MATYHFFVQIGIIGGSGFEDPNILQNIREEYVDTPFGKPSDALIHGTINGVDCVLLSRYVSRRSSTRRRVAVGFSISE